MPRLSLIRPIRRDHRHAGDRSLNQYDLSGHDRELTFPGTVIHFTETLHAVDMSDGMERPGSPVVIADTGYVQGGKAVSLQGPSVPGTGAGSVKGRVYFYVPRQLQRPGLTIVGNNVVIAFASYSDLTACPRLDLGV